MHASVPVFLLSNSFCALVNDALITARVRFIRKKAPMKTMMMQAVMLMLEYLFKMLIPLEIVGKYLQKDVGIRAILLWLAETKAYITMNISMDGLLL